MVHGEDDPQTPDPELTALLALQEGAVRLQRLYEDRQRRQDRQRSAAEQEAKLAEALDRVTALETELRDLRAVREREQKAELERLRQEIDVLRTGSAVRSAPRPGGSPAVAGAAAEAGFAAYSATVPAYLVKGYAEVTSLLSEAEVSEELEQRTEAAESRFTAAHRSCEVLGKLCDDEDYHAQLTAVTALVGEHDDRVRDIVADDDTFEQVRAPTLQLLVLAGLTRQDAARLVDGCRADFLAADGAAWRRPAVVRRNLRRLRNAICGEAKDSLRRTVQQSRRRDKVVPTLIKGIGGGVLAGVAGPLAGLVGAVPAAALGAIGAAAVEAAASSAGK
jgi:hypothetical protein